MWNKLIIASVLLSCCCQIQAHLMPGLYCGEENCYDVLGVTRDSTKAEISRSYRPLAKKYHPDNRETGDVTQFKRIANAYEILKDEEARKDYDYMLDNPSAYYQNYYRWVSMCQVFQQLSYNHELFLDTIEEKAPKWT